MRTRSQSKQLLIALSNYTVSQTEKKNQPTVIHSFPPFEKTYDFDLASSAWRANKKPKENGCFIYICMAHTKTGKPCNRAAMCNFDYCKMHTQKKI
jgi:hypothetical protein